VGDWARVSAVNDWSIPLVYVLLALATVGLSVALLFAPRRASAMLVEGGPGEWSLHVCTWNARRSALFRTEVREVVEAAAAAVEDE